MTSTDDRERMLAARPGHVVAPGVTPYALDSDLTRTWMVESALGKQTSPVAVDFVRTAHATWDAWALDDPELAYAVQLGDILHPDHDRWPASNRPPWEPEPFDIDAETTAEFVRRDGIRLGTVVPTICLADVAPERVEWLWAGRIPAGKLAILDGDPGLGKSTLAIDLAARVTTGTPLPDGAALTAPADVVLLTAEDGLADTVRPRFNAAGGDARRVHILRQVVELDDEGNTKMRLPELPLDTDRIATVVEQFAARLVIVDVLAAYLAAHVNSYRDQDVRRALHPLAGMAEATGTAVLVLRHLNKSPGTSALYRGGGSIGMSGAARSVLMVGADPDDDVRRVLAVVKSNLAPLAPSLAYRLVNDDLHGCARVAWDGTTTSTADDLVTNSDPDERTAIGEAVDFLREVLSLGPVRVADVVIQARKSGIAERTLRRARERLKVRSHPGGFGEPWWWEL